MNQRASLLTREPPYAEGIEMWEAFWHLEDLGRPLWVIPTPPAETLFEAHNLRGLNFGASETPFAPVWERFGGKTAILPHIGLNKEFPFESHVEFIEHIFRIVDHNRGLSILVTPPTLANDAVGAGTALGLGPHVVDDEFVGHFVQTTKETIVRCRAAGR
jgi:hypothetical protein